MAASSARPSSPTAGNAGGALLVVEYLLRVWRRSLVTTSAVAVGTPVIYLLALGFGLGTLVDAGPEAGTLAGVGYARFIAPALVTSAALATGIGEAAYPVFSRFKWSRVFWGVAASPVPPASIADGQALFIALRLTATSLLCYLVLLVAGVGGGVAGALMVPAAVLTGSSCAVWMMVLTAVMKKEGVAINVVMRFVVIPMTLFSGSFFPVDRLPAAVRPLAWISPLWHGTELARSAALHAWRIGPAVAHLGFLVVLTALGVLMARRKFAARLLT